MSLRLYNSATRQVEPFTPITEGQAGIYVCGATVQGPPHIGHLRPAVAFDILRRWLEHRGTNVTLVRNVTDIDDKVLAKAAERGEQWWARAAAMEREFTKAYDALNVLPPTYEPRATGHVPDMIDLMQTLMDSGHAYATGPGDVWFDVRSWPEYGQLTHQKLDQLEPDIESALEAATIKRSPYDFALWKAAKPGEPGTASWDTPWGRGRPGWHLECSAMAGRYLGDRFDIHGGGLDLRFPHHENEQAQSRAAGRPFANLWMHSAWITASGAKMSKSLGNGLLASELLAAHDPAVVRYAIASAHYRSMLEWGETTLPEAAAAWGRVTSFMQRATEFCSTNDDAATRGLTARVSEGSSSPESPAELEPLANDDDGAASELPADFVAAMDDDLNVPMALAALHEQVRLGNTALTDGDAVAVRPHLGAVREMVAVLGLDFPARRGASDGASGTTTTAALAALVESQIEQREQARAAKDWTRADQIRDQLTAAGIELEDSKQGTRWKLR